MSVSVSALRDLIAKWRKEADGQGAIYASGVYDVAEDLQTLLDAHPPAWYREQAELDLNEFAQVLDMACDDTTVQRVHGWYAKRAVKLAREAWHFARLSLPE